MKNSLNKRKSEKGMELPKVKQSICLYVLKNRRLYVYVVVVCN